eukprot:COSAG02_NODE_5501_length_4277_cov_2.321129_2_plen_84_part_00
MSEDLDRLLELGYDQWTCEAALRQARGDMRAAATLLAEGGVIEEAVPPEPEQPAEPEPESESEPDPGPPAITVAPHQLQWLGA